MLPIGGIVIGMVWAARAITGAQRGGSGKRPSPSPASGLTQAYILAFGLSAPVGLAIASLVGASALPLLALALELPLVAMVFPWTFTTWVLVPLGRYRLAYWLSKLSVVDWSADPHGGSTAASARALLNRRVIRPEDLAWVAKRLEGLVPLRGGGMLASGLLCAARGDAEGARAVLSSLAWLDPGAAVKPAIAIKLAREYLSAEAASRGEWKRVLELDAEHGQPLSRASWLLGALARRFLKQRDAPAPFGIWLRWALAPHRLRTLGFVRTALAYVPQAELPSEPPEAPVELDPLARAILFHARLGSRPIDLPSVRLAAGLWDEALSWPGLPRQVSERTLALGGLTASPVLDELRHAAADDLAARVRRDGLALVELGEGATLAAIARKARSELLEEVETMATALGTRADAGQELPASDEWRELIALRRAYDRATQCGGEELRRLVFPQVNTGVCSFAVWLWNIRREKAIAHAIFCWLRDEAVKVGDERAIQLQTKNAKLGG